MSIHTERIKERAEIDRLRAENAKLREAGEALCTLVLADSKETESRIYESVARQWIEASVEKK